MYTYRSIYLHVYSIRSLIYTFPLDFLRKRKFIESYMFKFKVIIFWTVYITKYIFINANVGDVLLSKVCVSYLLQLKAVMISSLHKRRKKNFKRIRLYFIPLLLLFFFYLCHSLVLKQCNYRAQKEADILLWIEVNAEISRFFIIWSFCFPVRFTLFQSKYFSACLIFWIFMLFLIWNDGTFLINVM